MAILLIDAEKAFDNVNWNFMLPQLEEIGTGQNSTEIINIIYSKQIAKIRINGECTQEIEYRKEHDKAAHYHHYFLKRQL